MSWREISNLETKTFYSMNATRVTVRSLTSGRAQLRHYFLRVTLLTDNDHEWSIYGEFVINEASTTDDDSFLIQELRSW